MDCLVTGGAGFIGSHLVDRLLELGHNVTVLDDFSTGSERNLAQDKSMAANGQLQIYRGSILDSRLVMKAVSQKEVIFHLAAQINVRSSAENPLFDAKANITGSILLYDHAARAQVPRIIYAASGGAMYGHPEKLPATEDTPKQPLSPYGISKLAAEYYLLFYGENFDMTTISLRYANVYGPRQDPTGEAGVISIFLEALSRDKPLPILGDGKDTRDYVFVSDIVQSNIVALDTAQNAVLNIGSGVETSVLELVRMIEEVTGIEPETTFLPPRPGEVPRIALDATRAHQVLAWEPTISLREGMRRVWDWFTEK
ncbi:MAG: GDP-mannose 4,6-dehydratase [Candidatus Hodarchaeales archaeon]|jgi:UDP-glucose 4-epimerase